MRFGCVLVVFLVAVMLGNQGGPCYGLFTPDPERPSLCTAPESPVPFDWHAQLASVCPESARHHNLVYLTQTEDAAGIARYYARLGLDPQHHHVIALTFARPVNAAAPLLEEYPLLETFYMPNSTWTQGRNALLAAAKHREQVHSICYRYLVFTDDDVTLRPQNKACEEGGIVGLPCECMKAHPVGAAQLLCMFELELSVAKPPVFTPSLGCEGGCAYDAIFNAFRRDALPVLLPYDERFDPISWWLSQLTLIYRIQMVYGQVAALKSQFTCSVNSEHRAYPRGLQETRRVSAAFVHEARTLCQRECVVIPYSFCVQCSRLDSNSEV
mmetsp:Transcript_16870/g.43065  ORF Transcript_16870/g.43065 Transcript_16870/m.43065 type:complete len:327 (-) Transcript_16870:41-1021(-)